MQTIESLVPVSEGEINDSWETTFNKVEGFTVFIQGALRSEDVEARSSEITSYLVRNKEFIQYAFKDPLLVCEVVKPLGRLTSSEIGSNDGVVDVLCEILSEEDVFTNVMGLYASDMLNSSDEITGLLQLSDFMFANLDIPQADFVKKTWLDELSHYRDYPFVEHCRYLTLETLQESPLIFERLCASLKKYYSDSEGNSLVYFYLSNLSGQDWGKVFSFVLNPFEDDDLTTVINPWQKTSVTDSEAITLRNIRRNVEAITTLGAEKTMFLHREFGIACFGRYPSSLLELQYTTFLNKPVDIPVTWFIGGLQDTVGAFYDDRSLYEEYLADSSLPKPMIVESDSARRLLSVLLKLKKKYRLEIPALVVLSGHGESKNVTLGTSVFGRISEDVLTENIVERGIKPLIEGSTVVFNSCGTGFVTSDSPQEDIWDRSIAEELAKRCNVTTIAPTDSITGIHNLKIHVEGSSIRHISLRFVSKSGFNQYKNIDSVVFNPKN